MSITFGIGNKEGDAWRLHTQPRTDIPNALSVEGGIHYHSLYHEERTQDPYDARKYDMGVVTLNAPLGDEFGYLGLANLDVTQPGIRLNVLGYPGDARFGANAGNIMYTMEGDYIGRFHDNHRIAYNIDTSPGQSGSGVWEKRGDECYCVAVHAYGFNALRPPYDNQYNSATYLTEDKVELIQQWLGN